MEALRERGSAVVAAIVTQHATALHRTRSVVVGVAAAGIVVYSARGASRGWVDDA